MSIERWWGQRAVVRVVGMALGVVVLMAMAIGAVGCGSGTERAAAPGAPTSPAGRTVVAITISGAGFQGAVLPEQAIQLTAAARYSDGATEDLTGSLTWVSSDDAVATVEAGRVTAIGTGEVTITARVKTDASTSGGSIKPTHEGSIKLSVQLVPLVTVFGTVRESSPNAGRPVAGAHVEVTGLVGIAEGAPRTTTTDGAGAFSVVGVRAPIRVRVSKESFDTLEQNVETASGDVHLDLRLYGGRVIDDTITDNFETSDRALDDQVKRYPFQFTRPGTLEANLVRQGCSYNGYYGVGFELWRDGARVMTASPGQCNRSLTTPVDANVRYELRVIGAWVWGCCPYRITVRHPE